MSDVKYWLSITALVGGLLVELLLTLLGMVFGWSE